MDIKIGELKNRITIQKLTTTTNENGFDVESEVEYCSCWAKVSNISGTEIFKNGADYSKVIKRFLIRFRKDKEFTTDMKIRYNNKLYDITYVNNYNESNEFIELIGQVIE